MIILVAIAVVDVILLAGTIWSARRKPVRARVRIASRSDGFPHAL
jgi:hypothetical protein